MDLQVQEPIFLSPTTKEKVAKHINSLNSKRSSDIYGTSATFLKTLSSSVSETYNEELRHVSEWLNTNKLSLNLGKSNLILFWKCRAKITYKHKGKGVCQVLGCVN